MSKFNSTRVGSAYTHYMREYFEALIAGKLDTYTIGESILIGFNRDKKGLPKTNLPYVVLPNHALNTRNSTIILMDTAGIQDAEVDLRTTMAILTGLYEDPFYNERFGVCRKFATKAFMNWVSRNIANRFSLSFEDKASMDILTATYFYCADRDPSKLLDKRNYKVYADLAEITSLGANRVNVVIDKFKLDELEEGEFTYPVLINKLKEVSKEMEEKVSAEAVTACLSRSWYNESGVFYCNLALEYPPMFITMLYFAIVDRSYSRSSFGNLVKEFAIGRKVDSGVLFTKQIHSLVKEAKLTPAR